MTRRPVHVAGRGAVTGYGRGVDALVEGIFSGERAVRDRRRTLAFRAPTRVAAELPAELFEGVREQDLPFEAGLAACRDALEEARLRSGGRGGERIGLALGTTKGDLSGLRSPGDGYGSPMRLARRLAEALELEVLGAVSTGCTSGVSALALAERRIAAGELDRALVLGVDTLCEFVMAGFGSMHILDPEPSRPYDLSRRGISLGDGAAALVLSADERESVGVRIAGHGGANDGIHPTGCDREGGGLALAVGRALAHAGIEREDVDFLHVHGTGTEANDRSEAIGLGRAFDGPTPPAAGTKGQTGHTLGAAGTVESLLTIAFLQRGELPANVDLVEPGVDPRLQLTRERRRLVRARHGLKVTSGFGGTQQAMVFAT